MEILTKVSVDEYFEKELAAEYKSEYHNGEVVAMAGATYNHNQIVADLIFLINQCLWGTECRVLPSDMLLHLPTCEKFVYPDITVVCETPKLEQYRGREVLLNPSVVIEVLSESTKKYDQGEKMNCYLELESLEQYILVDSEQIMVSSYTKIKDEWLFKILKEIKNKAKIRDCEIALEGIYRNVKRSV